MFYEVIVRAFSDSDGSGTGDLRGLIDRLDYLQWLGIDALWLPPFYPSPLRDGGYDVSDTAIAPQYGSTSDFAELVSEAHARMRVVIDLVMNHTSDQHPWFQASRADPEGPYGDFYVWSDDDTRYQDARIIFVDTETSNWTFDPVRRQFFWHRFFSHQPDLNFENPRVADAMLDVARFWLQVGSTASASTRCRTLRGRGHQLREPAADARVPAPRAAHGGHRVPGSHPPRRGEPVAARRRGLLRHRGGAGVPHVLPLPRHAAHLLRDPRPAGEPGPRDPRRHARHPAGAQWSTFLRNHDELTLEMVSTEERASMYGWYAPDPRMRANVGIRRRLAPLLDNSRKEVELAHALLLSLPGSPCLYYGDEIGMGDNIWLPDRDAVRTPMQWTPDRNAGFSTADPGKVYLPLVQSLVHHYGYVNVEAQLEQSTSLLHWVHGMLKVRRRHKAFGTGDFVALECDNESILAFLRRTPTETVLCVANLSATARSAAVHLPGHAGATLTDVFGGARFPAVGDDGRVVMTWGSRDFYWLVVGSPEGTTA